VPWRTLYTDDRVKVVLFGFGQGEERSEHTASMPAALHFLRGEAKLTPGGGLAGPGPLTAPGFGGRLQPAALA
jgi:quercetin dioxygenase-like cupin family protein